MRLLHKASRLINHSGVGTSVLQAVTLHTRKEHDRRIQPLARCPALFLSTLALTFLET